MRFCISLIILTVCLSGTYLHAKPVYALKKSTTHTSQAVAFKTQQIASGFNIPWGLTFLDDHSLLISERSGDLYLANLKNQTITKTTHPAKVWTEGQGGMLDVAKGPQSQWTYFTYSEHTEPGAVTVLARAKLVNTRWTNWEVLL